ncbi:hypothetical protein [Robbsia betulipollinis]
MSRVGHRTPSMGGVFILK